MPKRTTTARLFIAPWEFEPSLGAEEATRRLRRAIVATGGDVVDLSILAPDGRTVVAASVTDHADGTYGATFKLDHAGNSEEASTALRNEVTMRTIFTADNEIRCEPEA